MNEPNVEASKKKPNGLDADASSHSGFQELVREAQGGSEVAIDELLRSCRDYLLLVANQELGPHLQGKLGASDLVQSACLLAHRNIAKFRGSSRAELLAWLRTILRNEIIATHRHFTAGKRNVDLERSESAAGDVVNHGSEPTPSTEAIIQEEAVALRLALSRLPEDYRRAVVLRNWERLPFEEVGRRMDRSVDAAKKLWSRAIQQLRKELDREGSDETS